MDNAGDANRLNANIPLPATGEEAMKRLLACKGKDPYRYNTILYLLKLLYMGI